MSAQVENRYLPAVKAASALTKRSGAIEFKLEYSQVAAGSPWIACATFAELDADGDNTRIYAVGSNPGLAADRLAYKLLDGAVCRRCRHLIAVTPDDATYCRWWRNGEVWQPGCGQSVDYSIEMKPRV